MDFLAPRAHMKLRVLYCSLLLFLVDIFWSVLQNMTNSGSQVADTRPLSYCEFAPNSKLLATGSMYGCRLDAQRRKEEENVKEMTEDIITMNSIMKV
jgi:hypothetical protein